MSKENKELHKSKIGGQALIEGVMMSGVKKGAMACRLPNGKIDVEIWDKKPVTAWYRKVPLIRGMFNFIFSMIDGYKCLMKSAEKQMDDEELAEDEKLSDKVMGLIMGIAMVMGVALAVGLFVFLPKWIVEWTEVFTVNKYVRSIAEGVIKILIFIAYLALTALMKDLRRTYEYHGAEHKTIACLEAGLELTIENVRKQKRFHPRCGTSFIFITLIISIAVMCFVPASFEWYHRMIMSVVLLPVMLGISYELIRLAGRHTNFFTKALSAPGLCIQRLTTKEPDDKQIEVAIEAIKPCIPENLEEDKW